MAVAVAVVDGEAALAQQIHGLGADEVEAVVADEGAREANARLLLQPRQRGRDDLRLAAAPHERARVLVHDGSHDLIDGIRRLDARQHGQHEQREHHGRGGGRQQR